MKTMDDVKAALTRRDALGLIGSLVGAIGMLGATGLAACFSERPTDPDGNDDDEDGATIVEMRTDLRFAPEHVTIPAGTTVRWRNVSSFGHTATGDPDAARDPANVELPAGAAAWDSDWMTSGAEFSRTFDVPGEYRYVCLPHEGAGMIGRITVTE